MTPQFTCPDLPTRSDYERIEYEYISSLAPKKQQKALISQEMFDDIWDVLHDPRDSSLSTSQFRFWVRKMFTLATLEISENDDSDGELTSVILHEGRPVAVKSQIYDILCYCHQLCEHGGRDRTVATVRAHFSWIPKDIVSRFIKACPRCSDKKAGYWGIVPKSQRQCTGTHDLEFEHENLDESYPKKKRKGVRTKREAWNKQPDIETDVPLDAIVARFPQPVHSIPAVLPDSYQNIDDITDESILQGPHDSSDEATAAWLVKLITAHEPVFPLRQSFADASHSHSSHAPPAPDTAPSADNASTILPLPRSQSTTDASYPRIQHPPSTLVTSRSADSASTGYRKPFLVRPTQRRYHGHDFRSPSPVFSDDEDYCAEVNNYVAYPTDNKENDPMIDPTLLEGGIC